MKKVMKVMIVMIATIFINLTQISIVSNKHISVKYTSPNNDTSTKLVLYKFINDDDIPDSEKCVICMAKTEKEKALVPCGHTQFCDKCIDDIKVCSLCRKKVTLVMKIFK